MSNWQDVETIRRALQALDRLASRIEQLEGRNHSLEMTLAVESSRIEELERERDSTHERLDRLAKHLDVYEDRGDFLCYRSEWEQLQREREEALEALKACEQAFAGWERSETTILSREACQQWRSVAQAALASQRNESPDDEHEPLPTPDTARFPDAPLGEHDPRL